MQRRLNNRHPGLTQRPPQAPAAPEVSHQAIERALTHWAIPIPGSLLPGFERYHCLHNLRFLWVINLLSQFAFFLSMLSDMLVIPDVAHESMAVRVTFIALTLPMSAWLFHRPTPMRWLEASGGVLMALGTALWFTLLDRSQSPDVPTYLYASIIVIVVINVGTHAYFLSALLGSLLASVVILVGVVTILHGIPHAMLMFGLAYLPVLLFSLFFSWDATRSGRRAFLLSVLAEDNRQALLRANQKLHALANTDGLTGIANRRQFDEQAQRFWSDAQASGQAMALLIADIDHFKRYNDRYGHPVGDHCLIRVAQMLADQMRNGEYFAGRYGGEEFAILLAPAQTQQVSAIAQRLVEAVRQLAIEHSDRPDGLRVVTLSVGAALSSDPGVSSLTDLIHRSDQHLYQAKHAGRNQVCLGAQPRHPR